MAKHSNVTAPLITLPFIQHVLGLVRPNVSVPAFGRANAEWDLCLLFASMENDASRCERCSIPPSSKDQRKAAAAKA